MNEKKYRDNIVQTTIDYWFENPELLEQAFTRKSYGVENDCSDNELLEFIGDKALDIAVIRYLFDIYGYYDYDDRLVSGCDEGELTDLKKNMVQRRSLAKRITELGFSQFLIMGNGDMKNHVEREDSVKEDLFEAIVGAVAIDCNWNLDVIQGVVELLLDPDRFIGDKEFDYVSFIYDYAAGEFGEIPMVCYRNYLQKGDLYLMYDSREIIDKPLKMMLLGESNLDCQYYASLTFGERIPKFVAYGRSKREARREACILAYDFLKKNNMIQSIRDELDDPNWYDSISQLETLARRGYFNVPTYGFIEEHERDGNPIWYVSCHIDEIEIDTYGKAASKKVAKKDAAYKMLEFVLEYY